MCRRPYFGNHSTAAGKKLFPTSITMVLAESAARSGDFCQRAAHVRSFRNPSYSLRLTIAPADSEDGGSIALYRFSVRTKSPACVK